jgi:hypothetical protein
MAWYGVSTLIGDIMRETDTARTARELLEFLTPRLRLTEEESTRLEELLEDFVTARAEMAASDRLDREFRRGAYSY